MSPESIESVRINIQAPLCKNVNVVAVYRPPYHNNLPRFTSVIYDILKSISNLETTVNGGLLSPDNSERSLNVLKYSSSFNQHITVPIIVTENTATLIDKFWSNR